jgi:hypothetical protein
VRQIPDRIKELAASLVASHVTRECSCVTMAKRVKVNETKRVSAFFAPVYPIKWPFGVESAVHHGRSLNRQEQDCVWTLVFSFALGTEDTALHSGHGHREGREGKGREGKGRKEGVGGREGKKHETKAKKLATGYVKRQESRGRDRSE